MTDVEQDRLVDEIVERVQRLKMGELVFLQILIRQLLEKKQEGLV